MSRKSSRDETLRSQETLTREETLTRDEILHFDVKTFVRMFHELMAIQRVVTRFKCRRVCSVEFMVA